MSQLGLTRINAADAAGAAQVVLKNFYELMLMLICVHLMLIWHLLSQVVASEWQRETGAVASARAAAIYGLNILEEGIQVKLNHP